MKLQAEPVLLQLPGLTRKPETHDSKKGLATRGETSRTGAWVKYYLGFINLLLLAFSSARPIFLRLLLAAFRHAAAGPHQKA